MKTVHASPEQERTVLNLCTRLAQWRKRRGIPRDVDSSFVLLHAPLKFVNVPLLIVGQNPGYPAEMEDAHEHEKRLPGDHFLMESTHRYAFTALAIFFHCDRLNHLRFAQSTDVNFFRGLHTPEARDESVEVFKELVKTLNPSKYLINGRRAAATFLKRFRSEKVSAPIEFGRVEGHDDVFVCPHFSRRNEPPAEVWPRMIRELSEFLPAPVEKDLQRMARRHDTVRASTRSA